MRWLVAVLPPAFLQTKRNLTLLSRRVSRWCTPPFPREVGSQGASAQVHEWMALGRHATMSKGYFMARIQTSELAWAGSSISAQSSRLQQQRVQVLLVWILEHLVTSLVASHYYVTDTARHRNRLCFYEAKVWHRLEALALASARFKHVTCFGVLSVSACLLCPLPPSPHYPLEE